MAQKALLQIREAESQAEAIIKNAQEEAERIIKHADEKTSDTFSRFCDICKTMASEKKQKAEDIACTDSEEFTKETAKLCMMLREKLSMHKTKAVDAVMQMVVSQTTNTNTPKGGGCVDTENE